MTTMTSNSMPSNDLLASLQPTLLMGPGPSCVSPAVYQAMARPTLGHLDPRFIALMDEIKDMLRPLMGTQNAMTYAVSGTGSAGMETCFVNLIEPGDRVLILVNGVFGQRMTDVAGRLGAMVDALNFEWGTAVDVQAVADKLEQAPYHLVAVVHAETSTGVCNDVAAIGKLVKDHGALYLVDGVTSLGGLPVTLDAWGVDAFYSGTQKCLSCPPGLSPTSFSPRAMERLSHRKTKVPNWYLDVTLLAHYWAGAKRAYHHTAPINMAYALHAALRELLSEGPMAVFARHQAMHRRLVQGLEAMGLSLPVKPADRLPMLNLVTVPAGVDEAMVRSRLLKEYDIEIGAGLGPLAGKVWRFGLMGHTARAENVDRCLAALKQVLGH